MGEFDFEFVELVVQHLNKSIGLYFLLRIIFINLLNPVKLIVAVAPVAAFRSETKQTYLREYKKHFS